MKTSAKVVKSRPLTDRQRKFVQLKTTWPYPSSAKAARLAGYSESVARKADAVIASSPAVRLALARAEEQERERTSDVDRKRQQVQRAILSKLFRGR